MRRHGWGPLLGMAAMAALSIPVVRHKPEAEPSTCNVDPNEVVLPEPNRAGRRQAARQAAKVAKRQRRLTGH